MLIRWSLFGVIAATGLMAGCALSGATSSAGAPAAPAPAIVGDWQVEYIEGRGVIDYSPARLLFTDNGKINGNASCNRFFGDYQLADEQLTIKAPLGTTRMLCIPALNDQEARLLAALPGVHNIRIQHGILTLTNDAGEEVLRAAKIDNPKT
ncbi:META domain-containing protein [Gilvimarinus polysaccharolyticus]|uniref:META domain-containing protein n=1 Tax=Gilvimarinus polysaccharolyticus TaxID=863921 RepID=UPI00067394CF|nr:META domain-containing protein [Gilvimarinus polysaccharolyticus]